MSEQADELLAATIKKLRAIVDQKMLASLRAPAEEVGDSPTEQPTERATMPRQTKEQKNLLAALTEIAGEQFQQDDIARGGSRIQLPGNMTIKTAIKHLQEFDEAQEQYTEYVRHYRYRPWDGAAATERAIRRVTGTEGIGKAQKSFFGDIPPASITVQIGVNESINVPWGNIAVPIFGGDSYLGLGAYRDKEYGMLFSITAYVQKKHKAAVNGLFDVIEEELQERSIYKGKAITGAEEADFLDLSGVDASKVIYSDDVMAQLEAHLWGVIRYSDEMEAEGVSLKRSVLFHGPYGTGKTLGLMLTAQEAVANDYTFILCRPGKDDPFTVLQTAQLYAPAVVAIEDIDTYSRSEGMAMDRMSELLDKFDGIEAKGARSRIINVMTTNHEESITKGMLRPGRLDALVEIAELDQGGVERMVKSMVTADKLDDIDYAAVFESMEGYLPAFVSEAVTRAKNASIVRNEGTLSSINTADLINGAMSLRPQFNLMQQASEVEVPPTFDTVMQNAVRTAVHGVDVYNVNDDYVMAELQS